MRAYKHWLVPAMAVSAFALTGACTGDVGKAGADGAKGDKGDKGEDGEDGIDGIDGVDGTDGTDGEDGEDGQDAACAAFEPLAITGVVGVGEPVFPGAELEFELTLSGGSDDVNVQFIGTSLDPAGTVGLPSLPVRGAQDNVFTLTPSAEGDLTYVAIASDGCSIATTNFQIKVRPAFVSIVNLNPDVPVMGFRVKGQANPLVGVVVVIDPFFGPIAVESATLGVGTAFLNYFRIPTADLDLDMHPDLDLDGLPDLDVPAVSVPKIALAPDKRVIVVAYRGPAGESAFAVLSPDQRMVADDLSARVQLGHFAGGVGPIDIATDEAMSNLLFSDVALGELTEGELMAPVDTATFVDATGDGTPEVEANFIFGLASVLPGDYVVVLAWKDADDQIRFLVHDTGADGTQYAHTVFGFEPELFPFLGPPDVEAVVDTATTVTDFADITIDVDAPADCAVEYLLFHYDIVTMGDTWPSDVDFFLTAPGSDAAVLVGSGRGGVAGAETARIDASDAFAFMDVDGTWTLRVDDTFSGGLVLNSARLEFYCQASLGDPDKEVEVDEDPDLAIPDADPTIGVSSVATVAGAACTVQAVRATYAFTHGYPSDLAFQLVSPDGTIAELGRGLGTGATSPLLFDFAGEDGVGDWTLHVTDTATGDEGTLDNWSLAVYCE